MNLPFVIWTNQRTGGTALLETLAAASKSPIRFHEPFGPARQWDYLVKLYHSCNDWKDSLWSALTATAPIYASFKHCVEAVSDGLNRSIFEATNHLGYTHIFLRRDPVDRLFSLALATQVGLWHPKKVLPFIHRSVRASDAATVRNSLEAGRKLFPINTVNLMAHEQNCIANLDRVEELAKKASIPVLSLRDISDQGTQWDQLLFHFMIIDRETFFRCLSRFGVGSSEFIQRIPNYEEAREAFSNLRMEKSDINSQRDMSRFRSSFPAQSYAYDCIHDQPE